MRNDTDLIWLQVHESRHPVVSVVFCISALSGVRAQGPINSEIRNVRSLAKDRELEEDRALHDMLNASITDVYSIKPLMQVIYGSGPQAITDGRRVVKSVQNSQYNRNAPVFCCELPLRGLRLGMEEIRTNLAGCDWRQGGAEVGRCCCSSTAIYHKYGGVRGLGA